MNFNCVRNLALLILLICNIKIISEELDSTKTYLLAQINIFSNSAYNIYQFELQQQLVTDGKSIKNYNVSALPDIFQGSATVFMQKTNYGGGSPILRGMIGNRVLILIDGIKLNNSTFRYGPNQYFNTINPHIIEKVEVISGASAVNYGSDALGGVINVITKSRLESETASFYSQFSSADNGIYQNAEISHNINKFSFYGSGSFRKTNDLKSGKGIIQKNSGYRNFDLFFKASFQIDTAAEIKFNYQKNISFDVPRTDRYAAGNDIKYLFNPQIREMYNLSNFYSNNKSVLRSIETNLFIINQEEGREIISKKNSNFQTNDLDKVTTFGFINKLNLSYSNYLNSTFGVEYYYDNVKSKRKYMNLLTNEFAEQKPQFADGSKINSLGIYVKNRLTFNMVNIEVGLRYSFYKVSAYLGEPFNYLTLINNSVLLNSGISFNPIKDKLFINLNYSQGFRNPSLEDLTIYGKSGSGNGARFDVPNPNLVPELAHNFELGFKLYEGDISSSLYFYFTKLKDFIIPVKGSYLGESIIEGYPVYIRKNVERGFLYGTEWYLYINLLNSFVLQNQLNYTYGVNQTNDEPLSRIPPLNGRLSLLSNFNQLILEYYIIWGIEQDRLSSADKSDFRIGINGTDGFITNNFSISYYYKNFGVFYLRVENLFDMYYKTHGSGIYSPGRNFIFAVDLKI